MKLLKLKCTGILLGGFLLFGAGSGQALVSPEEYQKMKRQQRQKAQVPEKVPSGGPVKIQVHQPGEGHSPTGKAVSK
jgi:hypothetical protein